MASIYHTNGTCTATVATSSSSGNGVLGLTSADGVKLTINTFINEIFSDERGPNIPSEVLQNGQDAMIELELWKYDTIVLNNLLSLASGNASAQGYLNTVGSLMFNNTRTFALTLSSPQDGVNWYFPRCYIVDDSSVQLSTQLKIWNLKIKAVPGPSSGSPSEARLYQFI